MHFEVEKTSYFTWFCKVWEGKNIVKYEVLYLRDGSKTHILRYLMGLRRSKNMYFTMFAEGGLIQNSSFRGLRRA